MKKELLYFECILIFFLTCINLSGCIGIDTDGDKISDSLETIGNKITIHNIDGTLKKKTVKSDPDKTDTDNDGLNDYEEYMRSSDPSTPDTDDDGLNDKDETSFGTSLIHFDTWVISVKGENKRVIADFPNKFTLPTEYDTDKDGLSDSQEYYLGIDPSDPDTDDDGSIDFIDPDPLWNLKIKITLNELYLKSNKDIIKGADIYFIIQIGEAINITNTWQVDKGEEINFNSIYILDFTDSNAYIDNSIILRIETYDEDLGDVTNDDVVKLNGDLSLITYVIDIFETDSIDISTTGSDGELDFSIEILRS
jgi:hypothetical protein